MNEEITLEDVLKIPVFVLTPREIDVADLFVAGYSQMQIAKKLSISFLTVRTHIKNIYNALSLNGVNRSTQIIYLTRWVDSKIEKGEWRHVK